MKVELIRGQNKDMLNANIFNRHKAMDVITQGEDDEGCWALCVIPEINKKKVTFTITFEVDFSKVPDEYQFVAFDSTNGDISYHIEKPKSEEGCIIPNYSNPVAIYNEFNEINAATTIWSR